MGSEDVKKCNIKLHQPALSMHPTFDLKRNTFSGYEATGIENPNFPWEISEEQSSLAFIRVRGLLISFLQVRKSSRGNVTSPQLGDGRVSLQFHLFYYAGRVHA